MFQFFFLLKLDPVNTLSQTIHLMDLTELLLNGQHLLWDVFEALGDLMNQAAVQIKVVVWGAL